jgi:histidyl-tRNA synthetase
MKTEIVKGFNDYTGKEAAKRSVIQEIIKNIFERYGFEPAETPIVEYEEFVKGDNLGDEAVSDIFKLKDKGKRNLALRYELTFPLKRLMKNKKLPYKRFQIGPVFRDEPVKGNRFRQFTQCDVDVISSTLKDEAELLGVFNEILKRLKIAPVFYVNNRKLLNEILSKEGIKEKDREEVIRELDKLDKLSEREVKENLKKYKAEKIIEIFKKSENYFEKYDSYSEIKDLKEYSKIYGIDIKFQPTLARGLSYYNGSVFEIKVKVMKETIVAGGSYEFNGMQSTGLSLGLDRLATVTNLIINLEKILVVSLNQDKPTIRLAQKLRNQGKSVSIYYGKPSKALEYANAYGIKKVIFVGSKEVKVKRFKIKDMKTGREIGLKL